VITRATGLVSFTPLRAPEVHFHKCPGGREAVLGHGPDGTIGGCPGERPGGTIGTAGVVSDIRSPDRVGYLVGVFLPDRINVASPPETLDFKRRLQLPAAVSQAGPTVLHRRRARDPAAPTLRDTGRSDPPLPRHRRCLRLSWPTRQLRRQHRCVRRDGSVPVEGRACDAGHFSRT
jgi:hypothetical protein